MDDYEQRRYLIWKASPRQTLQHLMEARDLTQKDLWKVFGRKGYLRGVSRQVFYQRGAGEKTGRVHSGQRRTTHLDKTGHPRNPQNCTRGN